MALASDGVLERCCDQARYAVRRLLAPSHVRIAGQRLAVDHQNWSPVMVRAFLKGSYERFERRLVARVLEPGDRVLEIGGGVGLIALAASQKVGAENVFVYEANPAVFQAARENFQDNGAAIAIRNAAVVGDQEAGSTISFNVHKNFWSSSLLAKDGDAETITVPAVRLGDLLRQHRPNALIMDVEGAEFDILQGATLTGIEKLCIEIHTRYIGIAKVNRLIRSLLDQGLAIDFEASDREILYLVRLP